MEVARNKLQRLWQSSSLKFKFAATPTKPPKVVSPTKAKPPQALSLSSTHEFDILLKSSVCGADGSAASSSSGGGGGGGGGGGALSQLRAGWSPFGPQPHKKPKGAKGANTATVRRGSSKQKLHKPEAATLDILSPATELPRQLGRGDVQQKRKHKIERTLVPIIVGQGGVDAELAPKMRRSQSYAIPEKRSDILAECVQAYRAAAR